MDAVGGGGLSSLQKFPITSVKQLFHELIGQFCGLKAVNYSQYEKFITLQDWWIVKEKCTRLIGQHAPLVPSQGDTINAEFDSLSVEYQQAIQDCLDSRRDEIRQKLVSDVCSINKSHLTDFDWQLKLVMGSDKMANMHKPLASVLLRVQDNGVVKPITLELTKEELSAFIATLENANKAISQLLT